MQQDDEYEEDEETQVHDNTSIFKNQKGVSPNKAKNVKPSTKSSAPDKTKTGTLVKKDEKRTVMTQQVL